MEPVFRFNWIDAVAVILFIRIFYISVQKGFVVEFFKAFGTFVSLFFACHLYLTVAGLVSPYIPFLSEASKAVLVFLLIFFFFYILIKYLRVGLVLLFKIEPHYVIERWFSLLFGLVRGILILGIIFYALNMVNLEYVNRSLAKSFSFLYIKRAVPFSYQAGLEVYRIFRPDACRALPESEQTE
jgi:membrane protein required for colicin V production